VAKTEGICGGQTAKWNREAGGATLVRSNRARSQGIQDQAIFGKL